MRLFARSLTISGVSLVALSGQQPLAAEAGGFAVREQSATAQGQSFAGAASGSGGLSSMFWNPAAVTMRPGWNSEYHASLIIPEARIRPEAGTSPFLAFPPGSANFIGSGDIAQDAIVPASYTNYQLSDQFWIGLANSAPFGLVTKPRTSGRARSTHARRASSRMNLNPVLGYKVNDWLTIARRPDGAVFRRAA